MTSRSPAMSTGVASTPESYALGDYLGDDWDTHGWVIRAAVPQSHEVFVLHALHDLSNPCASSLLLPGLATRLGQPLLGRRGRRWAG